MDGVQLLIVAAAVVSGAIAWRVGHLVGPGVLCVLVTGIVLVQRMPVH